MAFSSQRNGFRCPRAFNGIGQMQKLDFLACVWTRCLRAATCRGVSVAPLTSSPSPTAPSLCRRRLQFCISESQCRFILSLASRFEPLFLARRRRAGRRDDTQAEGEAVPSPTSAPRRAPRANEAAAAASSPFNSIHPSICTRLKWRRCPGGLCC